MRDIHLRDDRRIARRRRDVVCTCESHCKAFNIDAGRFEGPGHLVSRSTRTNHRRDDRRNGRKPTASAQDENSVSARPTALDTMEASLIRLADVEVSWLLEVPLIDHNENLIFLHDPQSNGPYSHTAGTLIRQSRPNTGPYALQHRRVNQSILDAESRCYELVYRYQHLEGSPEVGTGELISKLFDLYARLDRERGLQWSAQRGLRSTEGVLVVTGTCSTFKLSIPAIY